MFSNHARIWLTVVAAAVLAACGGNAAEPAAASAPAQVGVMPLTTQAITISAEKPARLSASAVAQVRPQVSGIIQQRLFTEGALVQRGQPLYQIDPAPFSVKLAQADAALARAQANLANQTAKLKRYQQLRQSKAVSQQEFDEVNAALLSAKADVKTAQAQQQSATLDMQYSQVKAPITGYISKSTITVGALVSANQAEPLASITQLDPIYADFNLSSRELAQLSARQQRGELQGKSDAQPVQFTDETGQPYAQGQLLFHEVQVDSNTGSVTLRAQFANPQGQLLPGAFGQIEFVEGHNPSALLVPQFAISRNTKGEPTALVVSKENVVAQRVLQIDRAVQGQWLVQSGFVDGDQLIIEGLQKVRPGMPAQAVPAGAAPVAAARAAH